MVKKKFVYSNDEKFFMWGMVFLLGMVLLVGICSYYLGGGNWIKLR